MNRIAELRKEMKLNQIGLGMELNTSQYMVSAYETGRHQPTTDMLVLMADYFGVSVDYLIGRSSIRQKADLIQKDMLTAKEVKLIDFFRTLDAEKKEQMIGIAFALKNI